MTPGKAKRLKEARALLEGFWPVVFSFRKPQPLKVGITAELMADVETRGLPFTLEMLKSSLALYTNRIDYVRALADGCQRIGLDGNPAGEPTEEQRAESALHTQIHRITQGHTEIHMFPPVRRFCSPP